MIELLHLSERITHLALILMACVYTLRIIWLTRFKAGKERQAPTGAADTTPGKGIWYSLFNIAMPWAMESTRRKFFTYIQFVIFHLGITTAIALTFIIPFGPRLLEIPWVAALFQVIIGAAFIVGIMRIIRRVGVKVMRAISTPDDYFSLTILTVWFFFAFFSVSNQPEQSETTIKMMIVYFFMTTFFLAYVPFSKISHYLYYPFTRYYFGKSMGHRGVYPIRRGPRSRPARS